MWGIVQAPILGRLLNCYKLAEINCAAPQDEEAFAQAAADVESEIAGQAAEVAALKVSSEKVDKEITDLKTAAVRIHKAGAASQGLRELVNYWQSSC